MFSKTEVLKSTFDNVSGLQVGNNVRYSGINVGTVQEIEMIDDSNIMVEMKIDKKSFEYIKKDALASIGSDGLVGNMVVNIVPGKGNSIPVSAGDIITSVKKIRTDDMINTLSETNANAAILTADLLKITREISNGQGTIGLLLNDKEMAKDLKESIQYLKTASKGTTASIENLNALINSLDRKDNVVGLMKDTAIANNIKSIIANLEKSAKKIDGVVENLNAVVVNAKDGKGAINYLSNDPELVKKIDTTIDNINQSSKKLNENLEALKHNFLFKGYFKKRGMLND
jgi:phospholipid/cholesterol/gamma-HCH transport system substrate-binding protein